MIRGMISYMKKIVDGGTKESSKRFIAIWTMILVTIVVLVGMIVTGSYIAMLYTLLSFTGAVIGVSTWENIKNKDNTNDNNK